MFGYITYTFKSCLSFGAECKFADSVIMPIDIELQPHGLSIFSHLQTPPVMKILHLG